MCGEGIEGGWGEVWQLFLDWPLLLPFTGHPTISTHLFLHLFNLWWSETWKVEIVIESGCFLYSFWFGPILIILAGSVLWNCFWNFSNQICAFFHLLFVFYIFLFQQWSVPMINHHHCDDQIENLSSQLPGCDTSIGRGSQREDGRSN